MSEEKVSTVSDEELPLAEWQKLVTDHAAAIKAAAGFDLAPHILRLYWEEPFFATIMKNVTRVATLSIPTAGVTVAGSDIIFLWNPLFFYKMKNNQIMSVLKHECYHLILQHCGARRQDPHKIWNYATDLAINSIIATAEQIDSGDALMRECLYPGRPLYASPETLEKFKAKNPKNFAMWKKLSDLIASLPPQKASEYYHERLQEDEEIADYIENQGQQGQSQPGGSGQGQGNQGDPSDQEGDGPGGLLDDHGGWDRVSETNREIIKGKLGEILREAVREADSNNKWGNVPGDMRSKLREMCSNEVDWRSVLKQFVGMSRRAKNSTSMRKINRKTPYIHPGRKRGYTASISIYIDNSGSVDDHSLELFFGELNVLAKRTSFRVYFFDTEVHEAEVIEWKKGQRVKPIRVKCGGTDFNAPTRHANAQKGDLRSDGYLILTDGECYKPDSSRIKRGYVICPDRKLHFENELDSNDLLIKMKRAGSSDLG